MYIFQKNKSGYVLLSAIILLTIYSGMVFQIEKNRQANIATQSKIIAANEGRTLCNILILKRKTDKTKQSIVSNMGIAKVDGKQIVVILKNQDRFCFSLGVQPL
ncbi:hypothetical protein [Pediococcus inopinatus]|uniref:hypothetical protein n=1 Tax=Pediococcus inopinatus TaxID=114090 RepID=UPI00070AC369|nr:hypothetical protein [Pediococcus inopinatus]AVL00216.1 hypothetical protein PI20285_06005 [Pediococcus inopinatus]